MKPDRISKEKLARLSDDPIDILPFDRQSKMQALKYEAELNRVLAPLGVAAELFGSVELEIAGKGEWEYALYLNDDEWFPVVVFLINHFGSIHFLRGDMAVFTDEAGGNKIEVIAMCGETTERNRTLMNYWRTNPAALQEYERGKYEHSYSRRIYYWWKDEHIAGIVERL